jgi:coproporphyrinogen III oxidase
MNASEVHSDFLDIQGKIISELKEFDPLVVENSNEWQRKEGGGGKTCAFDKGSFLEKGGINFSDVSGDSLPPTALNNRPELTGASFRAMGISIVFHPDNPHVPTSHANVRFFNAKTKNNKNVWWFGGGFDLTPYYPYEDDVVFWHQQAKELCDSFEEGLYSEFKKNCDEYFYLSHRNETRGVGGIFFDDLILKDFSTSLDFCKKVMQTFAKSYFNIFMKRKNLSFGEKEKNFQNYRRGRYVEFNLVHDRGTHFGLQSGGRTESILMSMPPTANWTYNWVPQKDSKEEELYINFLQPRNWLEIKE